MIHGALSLYTPRGEYQINCVSAEPYGAGALAQAFQQLKKKLELKGYFDPIHKKTFPKIPQKIALVTSAKQVLPCNILQRVASHRWPLVSLIVIDVLVQGVNASAMIAARPCACKCRHAQCGCSYRRAWRRKCRGFMGV